jgi:hypothetical protein
MCLQHVSQHVPCLHQPASFPRRPQPHYVAAQCKAARLVEGCPVADARAEFAEDEAAIADKGGDVVGVEPATSLLKPLQISM